MTLQVASWFMFALSIAGALLNNRKNRWCFVVWGVANVGWIIINSVLMQPAMMALFTVFIILNLAGWLAWEKK